MKNYWENCEGDLKSWVDDWKNYWNDGNGLHGLTIGGHCFVSSMRNLGDSLARIVRWCVRIIVRP